MTTLPVLYTTHLDTLWDADLLCTICETQPWTTAGRYHAVLLCEDCAAGEPYPDEDDA